MDTTQPVESRSGKPLSQTNGIFIIMLLFIGIILFCLANFRSRPTPRWQYRIVAIPDSSFETDINNLGVQGWDLVFARRVSNGENSTTFSYEMIFKKPR